MKQILKHGPPVQAALRTFIKRQRAASDTTIPWGDDFLARLAPFATAGKLLRGSLVCFSYEMFSQRPIDDAVIKAAMALELTHSALLIHDDIMDGDELRRGRPSLHRQYRTAGEDSGLLDTPQFGLSMALCGGDTALFLAFGLLAESTTDIGTAQQIQRLFSEQLISTCTGQMQDVYCEAQAAMPPKRTIYSIMRAKTATYTLALPLVLGAVLAKQPEPVLKQLRALGTAGGTIFQIRDDELGAIGDTRKTGKPVGADIREGKKTLLYYYLLRKCSAAERRAVKQIFGNPQAGPEDITYAQKLIRQYRIPRLLNEEIAPLEKQAVDAIQALPVARTAQTELRSLVSFCATRLT